MTDLPKRVSVHINPELAAQLMAAKTRSPLKNLSELLQDAASRGFSSDERSEDVDYEELEL